MWVMQVNNKNGDSWGERVKIIIGDADGCGCE
jgi:hypothetical protein